jgi:CheY-like chemotaxis protein
MVAGRVLIADDNPAIRALLVEFLEDEGFEVFSAVNGQEAIEQARKQAPDCILMDLNMPVLDGVAAIHRLKGDRVTRSIRIYAMSARSVIEARRGDLRADGTLKKPFDLQGVLDTINGHRNH